MNKKYLLFALGLLFASATTARIVLALHYPVDGRLGESLTVDVVADRAMVLRSEDGWRRVVPGEVIIPKGIALEEEDLRILDEAGRVRRKDESVRAFADIIYFLLLLILVGLAVFRIGDRSVKHINLLFLGVFGSSLIFLELALVFWGYGFPPIHRLALPLATSLLVLIVIHPFRFAVLFTLLLLFLLAPLLPNLGIGEIVGLLGALGAVVGIRDRSRVKYAEAVGHFTLFLYLLATLVALSNQGMDTPIKEILLKGVVFAVMTGALVFASTASLLAAARHWFGILTPDYLIEVAAPDHPLLRDLAKRAPGTMSHVHAVQEIAEVGAGALLSLGGMTPATLNPWLVRVGALYHDVGKMTRPHFFSENQIEGENPHEDLSPKMSARLLISHVNSGVEIGKKYKLPEVILGIIRSHHGTTLAGHFHLLATEIAEKRGEEHPSEEDFRYSGPLPKTVEEVVIMVADSVEATSRALRDEDPEDIRAKLLEVLEARWEEEQLAEAEITIAQFSVLRDAVVEEGVTRHHRRAGYKSKA
ncbi:HDIG domain-containing protein [bacterium]|nr:HDIG domain-containing protein [bacterium]